MSQSEREKILSSLRGQTCRIPNLYGMFEGWPHDKNPHYDTLLPLFEYIADQSVFQSHSPITRETQRSR